MHRYIPFSTPRLRRRVPLSKKQETKFVRQLSAGQSAAWAQLIERWSPRLYSYIYYNLENEADSRRLMHEILAEAIHTVIDSPHITNLTVLIFSIAYRHILSARRRHSTYNPPLRRQARRTTRTHASGFASDSQTKFLRTLRQFTPEIQQILLLRYHCGVNLSDLSQIVGQSEEVLAQTLYRATRYL